MKKAREYNSPLIEQILSETSQKEKRRISNRMRISSRIANAMEAKGWNNNDLMSRMGKNNPSTVSRWLSGTHNFTTDTLSDLEEVLGINLLNPKQEATRTIQVFHVEVSQKISSNSKKDTGVNSYNPVNISGWNITGKEIQEYQA